VRPSPSALAIPPQSGKGVRESGWRLGRGELIGGKRPRSFQLLRDAMAGC
jgi:hypothetical protein